MAAEIPVESLQEEVSCPSCLEHLPEPVSVECGHSICREGSDPDHVSCPQGRETLQERNLWPSRQVGETEESPSVQPAQGAGGEKMCGEHQEALKLFCEEDQAPICGVCDRSQAHRAHTLVPMEEAAQEYKDKIQAHLKILQNEAEKLLELKVTGEKRSQKYLKQTNIKRQKIVSEFKQLRQFLKEQERLLVAQVEKLDKQILKMQDNNVTKLTEEISCLRDLIGEMEGKCQKPASEFLQDVSSTLSRCEKAKFQQPEDISSELEKELCGLSEQTVALMETMRMFKVNLPSALERSRGESPGSFTVVDVTLDPDTAHPQLVLYEDGKSVIRERTRQDLPDNPERFDTMRWVLGREGFTSGRHCWDVEVKDGAFWAVGVARDSVRRKGRIRISPEEGIWAVGQRREDELQAFTSPVTPLPQIWLPSSIRVCLDCDRGQVTFFNAGDKDPIFIFLLGSVQGERIRPWLEGCRIGLQLCP